MDELKGGYLPNIVATAHEAAQRATAAEKQPATDSSGERWFDEEFYKRPGMEGTFDSP